MKPTGDDALELGQQAEAAQGLFVRRNSVLRPPRVLEPRVLRPDAGVVKPSTDRVRLDDLSGLRLQDIGPDTMENTRMALAQRRAVLVAVETLAARLDADESDVLVRNEVVERANSVAASADASDDRVGELACLFVQLLLDLLTDHPLEIAHDGGEWVRADRGADEVVRVREVRDPVAQGVVHRVLERARAGMHWYDFGSKHTDTEDVQSLAPNVFCAHVDDALEAESRAGRGSGNTMLACAGLSDDAGLANPLCKKDLYKC